MANLSGIIASYTDTSKGLVYTINQQANYKITNISSNYDLKDEILKLPQALPLSSKLIAMSKNDILLVVNLYANNSSNFPIKTKKEKEEEKQITNYLLLYKKFKRYLPVIHKERLSYTNIIHASIDIMLNRISELQMEINNPDVIVNINRNCSNQLNNSKKRNPPEF